MLSLLFLVFYADIQHVFGNICPETVYMKIAYTDKLLATTYEEAEVGSVKECLEICRGDTHCKSVGIEVNPMKCVMYDKRAYVGLPVTETVDMVYYWQLEDECPTDLGYVEDPTSKICIKVNETGLISWVDAQAQCEQDGGHLYIADTDTKRAALQKFFPGEANLGATDSQNEGVWNWLNGAPINPNYFASHEPNGWNGEDCLRVVDLLYTDILCTRKEKFICEVPTKNAYNPS